MKLAAKQLLSLGVPPTHIRELDEHAEKREMELRELVQGILRAWLNARRPPTPYSQPDADA